MPLLSGSQFTTVIIISVLAVILFLSRHLLVPGVERFAAEQKREDKVAKIVMGQVDRLVAENNALQQKLNESERRYWAAQNKVHDEKNRIQILVFSYEHALGILERFQELCLDQTLTGSSLSALREISRESATLKTVRDILSENGN